jgi:hypothetical protein
MSRDERDKTISLFMTDDRATVLLMSLRCGGVGLNLTRANRVINIDLGWSEAVEAQGERIMRFRRRRVGLTSSRPQRSTACTGSDRRGTCLSSGS